MKYLLSRLYSLLTRFRILLYKHRFLKTAQLKHPVVSIGNITLGGTGKTPLTVFLAQTLQQAGYQPIILTRGYKRKGNDPVLVVSDDQQIFSNPEEGGDEPYLLAKKLPGIPVIVAKDRYIGGQLTEDQYRKVVYLLDDGYQHLRLKRDLNILIIDASDPFGGGQLVPSGRLREPISEIRRADTIIISRAHMPADFESLEAEIRRWNKVAPISYFHHDVTNIFDAKKTSSRFHVRDFIGQPVIALAAVGNPQVFLYDLSHYQMEILDQFIFRDHHRFEQSELEQVLQHAKKMGASAVVTTQKDAVRMESLNFQEGEIFVLEIDFRPENATVYKKQFLEEVETLFEVR